MAAHWFDSSDSDSENMPDFNLDFPVETDQPSTSKAPTFVEVPYQQTDFVDSMKNKNTSRATNSTVGVFRRWLAMAPRLENREISQIPPTELNNFLGNFILSIRKADGSEYEPDTLTAYQRGIDRHLRDSGYPYSVIFDREFNTSRDVLASKRKELKQKGKGCRPNRSVPLTSAAEGVLNDRGVIGLHSPEALQNKMWLSNTMHFGLRGTDENRKLKWGDIEMKTDENGVAYLEFHERDTKTRSGAAPTHHERSFHPKQFATPSDPENCPVRAFRIFQSHRPLKMCQTDSPFYLAINHRRTPDSQLWFKCQPLGENSLRSIMKTMASQAELPGKLTNHSARKSTATRLLHAGVAPTTIMQLTGHKNVSSVNQYAIASLEMQRQMSRIIANQNKSTVQSPRPSTSYRDLSDTRETGPEVAEPRQPLFEFSNSHVNTTSNSQNASGVFHGATCNNCTININLGQSANPISQSSDTNNTTSRY